MSLFFPGICVQGDSG